MGHMKTAACTVVVSADGTRCGKPSVYAFASRSDGKMFAECAEHYQGAIKHVVGCQVGDPVTVHRHGKSYAATVVKVGARGAVYAEVTYDNGATRTVRV